VGQDGITISASNVTIDLNGFVLTGVPGSVDGISISGSNQNLTVFGGTLTGWGEKGVNLEGATHLYLRDLQALSNGDAGIAVGDYGRVVRCMASSNGNTGIRSGSDSLIFQCLTEGNTGGGDGINVQVNSSVIGCVSNGNADDGIDGENATILNCAARSSNSGIESFGCLMRSNRLGGLNDLGGGTLLIDNFIF
jgi:hypothetical protein